MDVFESLKSITLIAMCLLGSIFCGLIIGSTVFLVLTCVDLVVGCTIAPFISVIVGVIATFVALCIMLDI